jgi:hypothetical protein
MIHSSRKSQVLKDYSAYICQAGHTNYIFTTTKKSDQIHHSLLSRFKEVVEDDDDTSNGDIEVVSPLVVAVAATRGAAETSTSEAATPCPLITPGTSR